jgi:hypothetical protein
MPTTIYDSTIIYTIDGLEIEISPLKIKYLKEFMEIFQSVKESQTNDESLQHLVKCCLVAMKQYLPKIKTVEDFEDTFDIKTLYTILDIGAGVKLNQENVEQEPLSNQAEQESSNWDTLDLAKLESEVFLLGIWKDYHQLETSLSMPELMATLASKRESDYQEKKFLAAMQGVDLDEANGVKEEDPWEAMKARVAAKESGIGNGNPNDITAMQGVAAQQAGFGIGMGLDYEVVNG